MLTCSFNSIYYLIFARVNHLRRYQKVWNACGSTTLDICLYIAKHTAVKSTPYLLLRGHVKVSDLHFNFVSGRGVDFAGAMDKCCVPVEQSQASRQRRLRYLRTKPTTIPLTSSLECAVFVLLETAGFSEPWLMKSRYAPQIEFSPIQDTHEPRLVRLEVTHNAQHSWKCLRRTQNAQDFRSEEQVQQRVGDEHIYYLEQRPYSYRPSSWFVEQPFLDRQAELLASVCISAGLKSSLRLSTCSRSLHTLLASPAVDEALFGRWAWCSRGAYTRRCVITDENRCMCFKDRLEHREKVMCAILSRI